MKLSIAIICSNDRLITRCLKSIPKDIPIIAVLNYPDEYVLDACMSDPRVNIIRCDERNLGKLRQLGADNCTTPAICYIDSDCILSKDMVRIVEQELEQYEAVNIPVYEIKAGDVIEIKEKSKKLSVVQDALNEISKSGTMPWVSVDVDAVKGTFTSIPRREEISDLADIKEQLIVEYYSK